jgi:hypothetical protein
MLQNTGSGSKVTFNSAVAEWSNAAACKTAIPWVRIPPALPFVEPLGQDPENPPG